MSQYFEVHPDNPQPRLLKQAVQILHAGVVHEMYLEREVVVELPDGNGKTKVAIRYAQAAAFILLKALAFDDRKTNKDAADLIHVMRHADSTEKLAAQYADAPLDAPVRMFAKPEDLVVIVGQEQAGSQDRRLHPLRGLAVELGGSDRRYMAQGVFEVRLGGGNALAKDGRAYAADDDVCDAHWAPRRVNGFSTKAQESDSRRTRPSPSRRVSAR